MTAEGAVKKRGYVYPVVSDRARLADLLLGLS